MLRNTLFRHVSRYNGINLSQHRTAYEKYRHGPLKHLNPDADYWQWLKEFFTGGGKQAIIDEYHRIIRDWWNAKHFPLYLKDYTTYVFEDFKTDESLSKWKAWVDSDALVGYSSASISRSRSGHALFSGILDTRCPDDGLLEQAGFAAMMGPHRPRYKIFQKEAFWDWHRFRMIEVKFRGDGRKYNLVVNTGSYHDDIQAYDHHSYPLYTRGGPYWQTLRVPFSKLVFCSKGAIQDEQGHFPWYDIKNVSFTLEDKIPGPFHLEIAHIGLRLEFLGYTEVSAYEKFSVPHIQLANPQPEPPLLEK